MCDSVLSIDSDLHSTHLCVMSSSCSVTHSEIKFFLLPVIGVLIIQKLWEILKKEIEFEIVRHCIVACGKTSCYTN